MSKKILILEKNINISHSLQTQFLIVGFDVLILDGNERDEEILFSKILDYRPDYMIIDLELRNFNSFDIIKAVKKNDHLNAGIFVYAKIDKEIAEKCQSHGVDYWLSTDDINMNQFAVKVIKIINNQEKII